MKRYFSIIIITAIIGLNVFVSCVNEENYSTASNIELKFSSDTVSFDTIFTTVGSVTKQIRVFNPENEPVKLDYVTLGSGNSSYYRLNVDGDTSLVAKDVVIGAKDSIFIFVRVELDQNNQNNPLLVEDSVIFGLNGKRQRVLLMAYGQDAYYHKAPRDDNHKLKILEYNAVFNRIDTVSFYYCLANEGTSEQGVEVNGNTITWKNDKPHVIVDNMVVDSAYMLSIGDGTKIYMGNASEFWVYTGGTLKTNGTTARPVEFLSLRTQDRYSDIPGQWGRIWLMSGSKDNIISNTIIKNAVIGVQVDTTANDNHTLEISNTFIENCSQYGLLAQGSDVYGYNLAVQNAGTCAVRLALGGRYEFYGCTFANYWSYDHNGDKYALELNDWYKDINGNIQRRQITKADFYNVIVYGSSAEDDLYLNLSEDNNSQYSFENCLLKYTPNQTNSSSFKNCIYNKDPLFADVKANDLHLREGSAAVKNGNGIYNSIFPYDIYGSLRSDPPCIGAVEYRKN